MRRRALSRFVRVVAGFGAWLAICILGGWGLAERGWAREPAELVRHAVVVGANLGGGTLDPLRYAERDAESFAQVLTELGGFSPEHVTVLYQPDIDTLRRALAHHAALSSEVDQDLFVFYYSGHADGHGLRLDTESFWFDALKHDIRLVDSTARVGILDACRAGAITRLKGARVAPSLFAGTDQLAARGEVWMTATSADELAQESEVLRGGYFSHYLLSGLRGAAAGRDGLVEVQQLYAYTREKVVARSAEAGGVQRPTFDFNLVGERGIALTDVRRADAALTLTADRPGHVSIVRLADRVQLAEVDVPVDRDMRIALPPSRYAVRLRDADGLHESTVTLVRGVDVQARGWRSVVSEEAYFRGGQSSAARSFQDRMVAFQNASEGLIVGVPWDQNPVIAGSLSTVIPGGGQVYNRQPFRGMAYFLGTASLLGASSFVQPSTGASPPVRRGLIAAGIGLWGASVADAVYGVHRAESERPRIGPAVGLSMGFSAYGPRHLGLMAEYTPVENLTFGLDRTGAAWIGGRSWDVHIGSRMIGALEYERFRPGIFASFGARLGQAEIGRALELRGVFGAGALVRYYVVPRYFLEVDGRWERDGRTDGLVLGLGLGVPLGRAR